MPARIYYEVDGSLLVEKNGITTKYRRAFVGERHDFETLPGPDWDEPTGWVREEAIPESALPDMQRSTRQVPAAPDRTGEV